MEFFVGAKLTVSTGKVQNELITNGGIRACSIVCMFPGVTSMRVPIMSYFINMNLKLIQLPPSPSLLVCLGDIACDPTSSNTKLSY